MLRDGMTEMAKYALIYAAAWHEKTVAASVT